MYMSRASPCSKTGHVLLHASKTCWVSIPCRLKPAGMNDQNCI